MFVSLSLFLSTPLFLCALEGDGEWFRVHGSGFSDKLQRPQLCVLVHQRPTLPLARGLCILRL